MHNTDALKRFMTKNNTQTEQAKTLVLLDAHAILHRAFHALPSFTAPSGEPTGALYGFVRMLLKIIRELKPDYLAACYDLPEPTFRHIVYKQYKATRPSMEDALAGQINRSRDVLAAFGIPAYAAPGFEADDVLGTITAGLAKRKQVRVVIASGDTDTLQLVEGNRSVVYMLRKGIEDTVQYDEKAVRERFGFGPTSLPDFKGLKGDPSDNIPGVPGVGEKTASVLISAFGTLEELYDTLERDEQRVAAAGVSSRAIRLLHEHKEEALFSRELAKIRTDAPVTFSLQDAKWEGTVREPKKVSALFGELGFRSLEAALGTATLSKGQQRPAPTMRSGNAATIVAIKKQPARLWFVDEATNGVGVVIEAKDKMPEVRLFDQTFCAAHRAALGELFMQPSGNTAFGAKRLLHALCRAGIAGRFEADLFIAGWLCDPDALSVDAVLGRLIKNAEGASTPGEHMAALFSARSDVLSCIRERNLERVFYEIEMPLIHVLFQMESRGMLIDRAHLRQLSRAHRRELSALEAEIRKIAGTEFNIASPKQLADVLFVRLGIGGKGKRTKTGGRTTRFAELAKLRASHPIVPLVLRYRELAKLLSTYIVRLPELVGADGRVHTEFQQTGTATGRLSSTNPNLQNIPIRTREGNDIRNAFLAPDGWLLLACDYSQIELRIAAMISNDEKMPAAFRDGKDIHAITAAAIFGVPEEKVDAEMRHKAKIVNFGILYGMGAGALAENLGVSRQEAARFIEEYFQDFAGVRRYVSDMRDRVHAVGYVETLFGRRRYFSRTPSWLPGRAAEAERMAINAPIQGTNADIIKRAMIAAQEEIVARWRDDAALLLQIHDELLFEVREQASAEFAKRMVAIMQDAYHGAVPLRVNAKVGKRWGALEKLEALSKP